MFSGNTQKRQAVFVDVPFGATRLLSGVPSGGLDPQDPQSADELRMKRQQLEGMHESRDGGVLQYKQKVR